MQYRSNGTSAIASSAKQLLFVKDFASNHNGGQLQFGPDKRLYWGNGDGGGGGDPQHNGQSLARPFAKIMRLNIDAAKPRWELVAYGLRNPWRFSFDRATGDLYIGDVGQSAWEEIDYLRKGAGRRQLRLEPLRGPTLLRSVDQAADSGALPRADRGVPAFPGLLGHRRLRLPRQQGQGGGGALLLRRLLLGERLEPEGLGRQGARASGSSRSRSRASRRSARTQPASCTRCRSTPATSSASRADTPRRAVSQGLSPGHGAVGHVPGTVPRSRLFVTCSGVRPEDSADLDASRGQTRGQGSSGQRPLRAAQPARRRRTCGPCVPSAA